jgi:hypothetical protein
MKLIVKVVLAGILIGFFNGSYATQDDKVAICHWDDDEGYYEPISVAPQSVTKHVEKHGDVTNPFITANDDPIWSNDEAQSGVCAERCAAEGGTFTGAWWTTVDGGHSVCQCTCS